MYSVMKWMEYTPRCLMDEICYNNGAVVGFEQCVGVELTVLQGPIIETDSAQ